MSPLAIKRGSLLWTLQRECGAQGNLWTVFWSASAFQFWYVQTYIFCSIWQESRVSLNCPCICSIPLTAFTCKSILLFFKDPKKVGVKREHSCQGWIQSSALDSINNGCPWTHCSQDEWNIFHPLFASILGTSANYEKLKNLELAKNC